MFVQSGQLVLANTVPKDPTFTPSSINNPTSRKPGDTMVTTTDGAMFHVHFDILAFASPVFCSLLTRCTAPNTYKINETSDVFFCFMAMAYSRDIPVLGSFRALDNALQVASKYELSIMKKLLRAALSDPNSQFFLEKDPISSFEIALKHDFAKELSSTSRQLVQYVDIRDSQYLELLRAHTVGTQILNMLALRQAKLADLLLSHERGVVIIDDSATLALLSCQTCCAAAQSLGSKQVQWMMHWAQNAYETLSSSCVTTQDRLFGVGCVLQLMSSPMSCTACRTAIVANPWTYENWMKNIKEKIELRLLTELESQIRLGSSFNFA
ncbi:hypothetical protein FRC12_006947 [Ceratobasidium sp. 428]|nr:hypothetical protein FRC12_006947 [Ceratobasidium sp. 428]